jgi:hypothetical protein
LVTGELALFSGDAAFEPWIWLEGLRLAPVLF